MRQKETAWTTTIFCITPLQLHYYRITLRTSLPHSTIASVPTTSHPLCARSTIDTHPAVEHMANEQDYIGRQGALRTDTPQNMSNISPPLMTAEDEIVGDLDEPPEPRAQRPAPLALRHSSTTSFTKSKPLFDRKESLLTSALKSGSNASSPVEEHSDASPVRGMSCVSTWSNNSGTADLTSDGGFTSPGTRPCTPSPPPPSGAFHNLPRTARH